MRHHNRARLIDIAENNLNPKEKHVVGKDGKLIPKNQLDPLDKDKKSLPKKEKVKEVPADLKEQNTSLSLDDVKLLAEEHESKSKDEFSEDVTVEKKPAKKKPFGRA